MKKVSQGSNMLSVKDEFRIKKEIKREAIATEIREAKEDIIFEDVPEVIYIGEPARSEQKFEDML